MANHTTGAQRYNNRMDKIWAVYRAQEEATKDKLPTCADYGYFLGKAVEKLNISIGEARTKYGRYTYGQWKELLNL